MGVKRWLNRLTVRQRAQNTLEYGLVVATIAIAAIGGVSFLQGAETAYFTGMQTTSLLYRSSPGSVRLVRFLFISRSRFPV